MNIAIVEMPMAAQLKPYTFDIFGPMFIIAFLKKIFLPIIETIYLKGQLCGYSISSQTSYYRLN